MALIMNSTPLYDATLISVKGRKTTVEVYAIDDKENTALVNFMGQMIVADLNDGTQLIRSNS